MKFEKLFKLCFIMLIVLLFISSCSKENDKEQQKIIQIRKNQSNYTSIDKEKFRAKNLDKESFKNSKYEVSKIKELGKNVIIVRTPENFVRKSPALEHLNNFEKHNISTIILLVKNDEDLPHMSSGEVFYKSKIVKIGVDYKKFNFDALNYTINFAKKHNISVFAWVPQFHDKVIIEKNKDFQMKYLTKDKRVMPYNPNNEYFANPIRDEVRNYELEVIKEIISNYDIDGVFLDWIRFDNFNQDLSKFSREKFKEKEGFDPITIDFSSENEKREIWNNFRENIIAEHIKNISFEIKKINPNIKIGVFILPIEMKEVAQNPSKFEEFVDYVGVMLYYNDWGFEKNWIYKKALPDLILNMNNKSKIVAVLDAKSNSCNDEELLKKINNLNITKNMCFYYRDWNIKLKQIYS